MPKPSPHASKRSSSSNRGLPGARGSGMRPLRLLLVEDSENDAVLLLEHLRQGGYEPLCTRDDTAGALTEVLDKQGRDLDLVIADYTMPGFSGTAALSIV